MKLNPNKASGSDGIPNWLMREYAEILAPPVPSVLNSSFAEQRLPPSWKQADVVPIPKLKSVSNVNKHLRPISLTPAISKIAEDFVVSIHVGPAVLKVDSDQFGAIPNSFTVQTLMSMLHHWTKANKKAFDLIDHHLLVRKIYSLSIPRGVAHWVIGFLTNRKQRVKLSSDCFSEWGPVPSGVSQGTKLGPWLFLLMINDFRIHDVRTWKYVDDTTIAETVPRDGHNDVQRAVTAVEDWSRDNHMQLNADKCKEMIIDFKRNNQRFQSNRGQQERTVCCRKC